MDKLKNLYKKMSVRERFLFYGAIASAIIMITDLVVLNPILSHIEVLDAEIKAKSQAIQRDLRILSFEDTIIGEYARYQEFLDSGNKSQEEIIARLLKKLETLASENGIKITNIMPGEIEEKPIYKVYKTTLEFEGPLRELLVFMALLEESDNLFQILHYELAPKNRSGQVMKVVMDVSRILIAAEDMSAFTETLERAHEKEPPSKSPKEAAAESGPDLAGLPEDVNEALPEAI